MPLTVSQELLDRNLFNWVVGTMQPCTLFDNLLFRQIWYDIFAGTDLRTDFLAVWTALIYTGENLASIVYTVLSELDIGAKLLQLLPRDNASLV